MTWNVGDVAYWTDNVGVWRGTVLAMSVRRLDTLVTVSRDVREVDFGGHTADTCVCRWGDLTCTPRAALARAVNSLCSAVTYFQALADDEGGATFEHLLTRARWKLSRALTALIGPRASLPGVPGHYSGCYLPGTRVRIVGHANPYDQARYDTFVGREGVVPPPGHSTFGFNTWGPVAGTCSGWLEAPDGLYDPYSYIFVEVL